MKRFFCVIIACIFLLSVGGCRSTKVERSVYRISASFDGERTVSAEMTFDYFNSTDTEITELAFNLYPNAYRKGAKHPPVPAQSAAQAFPNGVSYGGIEVVSCKESGDDLEFKVCGEDENILVLYLKKGVFPAERVEVEIKFKVELAECRHRLGVFDGVVNLSNWYPVLCYRDRSGFYLKPYSAIGDPFCSEVADYFVELSVPGEFTVASGGDCVKTEVGEEQTRYSFECRSVRDVAFSLCKEFEVFVGKTGDIDILFYHKGCDFAPDAVRAAELAIKTYGELFGEYPYSTFTVASVPFLQGGMEYPCIVYVSDRLEEEQFIQATLHEAAHQWWYGMVGCNQYEHAFLDEGLAEYSTLLFYENHPEYGVTRESFIEAKNTEYREFYGVLEQLTGKVNTVMERPLDDFSGEYEYVEIAYVRSVLMLDGLRESVGDARFKRGLKAFFEKNRFAVAGPEHLAAAFRGVGSDAEGYLYSWIEGRAVA
ncbi:MAG: M1 family metallopeptidase [Clostridia bacterium]|nr:M1 family metallopeptidase [Clostridia bacterium]